MGLGQARDDRNVVSLKAAREAANRLHVAVRAGRDPLADRNAVEAVAKAAVQQDAIRAITFHAVAEGYLKAHAAGWSNHKHGGQ